MESGESSVLRSIVTCTEAGSSPICNVKLRAVEESDADEERLAAGDRDVTSAAVSIAEVGVETSSREVKDEGEVIWDAEGVVGVDISFS
ncbi:hypothetical protein AA0472_2287 [Acetobacter estunensis NRIC 0472]|nr:hypothetical protein AA0472_2287 [Acetobacter estunensis NRIC 0472]